MLIKFYPKKHAGFTLMEILVVIVIIGIVSAVTVLRHNNPNNARQLTAFAEQLKSQIQLAREQSIVETSSYGLMIKEKAYEFCQYEKTNKQWISVKDNFWKPTNIPDWVKVTFVKTALKEAAEAKGGACQPQIIFYSSGVSTPFKITVHGENIASDVTIIGGSGGSVSIRGLQQ